MDMAPDRSHRAAIGIGVVLVVGFLLIWGVPSVRARLFPSLGFFREKQTWSVDYTQQQLRRISGEIAALEQANDKLEKKTQSLSPDGNYIAVNTHTNRLYLRKEDGVILDAVVSTGSGEVLLGPRGRKWIFNTPKGIFRILRKARDPIWTKPDWAFVEEEETIPPVRSSKRLIEGYLGEYALYIGDGYMIHGTLYTRTLGKSITHGCIRMDDEALEEVYRVAEIGTKVYIY